MASFINRLSFFARSMGSSASSIAGTSSSTTMSAKVQQLVESSIESNFIVVFSKSWCSYSRRAKQLISSLDLPKGKTVQVFELDRRDDGYAIQSYLEEKTGQSTVPNIFINKEHIGGSDDLGAAQKSGKLKKILAAASAEIDE